MLFLIESTRKVIGRGQYIAFLLAIIKKCEIFEMVVIIFGEDIKAR